MFFFIYVFIYVIYSLTYEKSKGWVSYYLVKGHIAKILKKFFP